MKKIICLGVLIVILLLVVSPQPSYARGGHGRVFVGTHVFIGPGFWGPSPWWGPGWWGPPYYYAAPPVVVEPPPTYVQPTPVPEEPQYWYYCQDPQGYYPYIQQCPKGWMKVVPPVTPPGQ
jgi:hypothetical protein